MTGAAGLALGTAQWGFRYGIANRTGQPSREAVAAILGRARQAGVTALDTARAYGESEAVIGGLIGPDPGWAVVTKLDPAADTPAAAARSVADSLTALRRARVDTLLLHRPAQRAAAGGAVWDALRRDRDAGRVGSLGVSAVDPADAWAALDDPDVACVQVAASLFDQRLARAGFFPAAAGRGKTVFVRSVFLQGVGHLRPDELPPHLAGLAGPLEDARAWAAEQGVGPGVAFLAFAAGLAGARVLVGCETAGQLDANLRAWAAAGPLAAAVGPLAAGIPDLPAEVVNPARWPAG